MKKQILGGGTPVLEYTDGNTRIRICDDCCRDKTQADIDAILHRIAAHALPYIIEQAQDK